MEGASNFIYQEGGLGKQRTPTAFFPFHVATVPNSSKSSACWAIPFKVLLKFPCWLQNKARGLPHPSKEYDEKRTSLPLDFCMVHTSQVYFLLGKVLGERKELYIILRCQKLFLIFQTELGPHNVCLCKFLCNFVKFLCNFLLFVLLMRLTSSF